MIFDRFLTSAEAARALDERAFAQAMLDFEAALALAQSEVGAIPAEAGAVIADACDARRLDIDALVADGARAGTLAIPLVRQLAEAVAQRDPAAAAWVHWGATSQDVLDTAQVLVARDVLALVDRDLGALVQALLALAAAHADAPMLGRTLLQPAQVIAFGTKAASWIAPLVRAQARLHQAGAAALQVQLGGAVGTRVVLAEHGDVVLLRLARDLRLRAPAATWHAQRDELVALGCELGLLAGSLGKIARDVSLLAQGEVGEMAEPSGDGRGGSSTMPHKRNPVASMTALAAATRAPQRVAAMLAAMQQAHERGLGDWQAELAEFQALLADVHGALAALAQAAPGLQVHCARMRRNIDACGGLVFAEALAARLARVRGKGEAHRLVEALCREAVERGVPLQDVAARALADDIAADELAALFDPAVPARHAAAQARTRLDVLAAQAAVLRRAAPWQDWLPQGD